MRNRQRQLLTLLAVVVSLTVLAAPARGADWVSVHVGSHGFGLSIGSSDWWAWGRAWDDPSWAVSYDAALGGYGEWVWVDGLGRVWQPWVATSWRPFTHGRWVTTSLGWTWVSYEPWGYFPHHYGTWARSHRGWVWVPGYSYRPANVVWVQWGGFVGWYPCPPRGWSHADRAYDHGFRHGYGRGYDDGWRDAHHATYVRWDHLAAHDVSRHSVAARSVQSRIPNDNPRTSTSAPTRSAVLRRGVDMVPRANIEQRTVQVGDRRVTVTRPAGMTASIERHARETVNRALAPEVSRRVTNAEGARSRATNTDRNRTRVTNGAEGSSSNATFRLTNNRPDRRDGSQRVDTTHDPDAESDVPKRHPEKRSARASDTRSRGPSKTNNH
jgi:hypothetical protein